MNATNRQELLNRLQGLEKEIFALRRELAKEETARPTTPYEVLQADVDDQTYALDLSYVREVVQRLWFQPLPDAPPWVLGTFRLGDEVIPAIDAAMRLHGNETAPSPSQLVVIVDAPSPIGLLVNRVSEITEVSPDAVKEVSEGIRQAPFLQGVFLDEYGQSIHILSVERLCREFILDEGADGTLSE